MDIQQQNFTRKVQQTNIKEALDKKFCDLVFSLLGKEVKIKETQNTESEGLFYTINPKNGGMIIKNYKQIGNLYPGEAGYEEQQAKKTNDNNNNVTKCFSRNDFVYLFAENVDDPPFIQDFQNLKNKQAIKTDGELTKLDKTRGRQFQAVDFIFSEGGSLEDGEELNSKSKTQQQFKQLDQFQINQQKFGVGTDFKDEYYTTKLDISKINKEQIQLAEKLEQEVLKEGSKNKHVLIDRGRDDLLDGSDEEKNFSAVHGSGRYNEDGNVVQKNQKKDNNNSNSSSQNNLGQKDNQDSIRFGNGKPSFKNNSNQKTTESSTNNQPETENGTNNQQENKTTPSTSTQNTTTTNTKSSATPVYTEKTVEPTQPASDASKQDNLKQTTIATTNPPANTTTTETQKSSTATTPQTLQSDNTQKQPETIQKQEEIDNKQKETTPTPADSSTTPTAAAATTTTATTGKKKLVLSKKVATFNPSEQPVVQQEDATANIAAQNQQQQQQNLLQGYPYDNGMIQQQQDYNNYGYQQGQHQYQGQFQYGQYGQGLPQQPLPPQVIYPNMMQYPPQQPMYMQPPPQFPYAPNLQYPQQGQQPNYPHNNNNYKNFKKMPYNNNNPQQGFNPEQR